MKRAKPGYIRDIENRLIRAKRLPGLYCVEEGWLHCRMCRVGIPMGWGEVPEHADGCEAAKKEAA